MKFRSAILSLACLSLAAPAFANDKSDVEAAFGAWRAALSGGKAESIVNLYARDAVLLATLEDKPITNQRKRTQYFEGLVKRPELKATVNSEYVRLLDEDDAVVSGVYTFSFKDTEKNKTVKIPARYTFVFEKTGDQWMIVEHHSSMLPSAQK